MSDGLIFPRFHFTALAANGSQTFVNTGQLPFILKTVVFWAHAEAGESCTVSTTGDIVIWSLDNTSGSSTIDINDHWDDIYIPLGFEDTLVFTATGVNARLGFVMGGYNWAPGIA